jgi:hypothetical protein
MYGGLHFKSKPRGAELDNGLLRVHRPLRRAPPIRRQMAPADPHCLRKTAQNKA